MDESTDDGVGAADDEVAALHAIVTEFERVIGPLDENAAWWLPASNSSEVLELLRAAPTGLGLTGLARLFLDRFGSLHGLKPLRGEDQEPNV